MGREGVVKKTKGQEEIDKYLLSFLRAAIAYDHKLDGLKLPGLP